MGYINGMKALNMEFSDIVPRTEYSAHVHWELVKKVTGIDTDILENRDMASAKFMRDWDYSTIWYTHVGKEYLERYGNITNMGHAEYANSNVGETDKDNRIFKKFTDIDEALSLDCTKAYGNFDQKTLIGEFENAYSNFQNNFVDTVNMGGVYITLFSGLTYIYGWDMLLECMAYPEFKKVLDSYYEWVSQFFNAYAKSNIPVFMCHDDMCWTSGAINSNQWYKENIFPYYKKLLAPIKESGKKIIFTSDGNYTDFFDDVVDCGADMLVFEPCSDMEGFAKKYGKTHGFIGNVDTRVLLMGSKEDIYNEVKRCMDFGKEYAGFILAVGNHIPPNTPVDNALYYDEVYRKLSKR